MLNIVQDSIQETTAQGAVSMLRSTNDRSVLRVREDDEKPELSSLLPLKPDYILVFEHPKLESEVIRKVFPEAKLIKFSKEESLVDLILGRLKEDEISRSSLKCLILTFQCWSDPKLEGLILNFKKYFSNTIHEDDENAENGVVQWSLHVECDFESEIADINLGGANAVHYKALSFL
jgi:hypothetical protein